MPNLKPYAAMTARSLSLLVSLAGPEGGEVAGGGFLFGGSHGGELESQEAQDGGTVCMATMPSRGKVSMLMASPEETLGNIQVMTKRKTSAQVFIVVAGEK